MLKIWVTRVKSGGREYFYLATYCSESSRREKNVFALGKRKEATITLENWLKSSEKAPRYLFDLGLTEPKIKKWKNKIS